jgi:uncharacterized protein (TIGR00299 family) protein
MALAQAIWLVALSDRLKRGEKMSAVKEERTLYLECNAGISGDMMVGALLHLGMPFDYLKSELSKLDVGYYNLDIKRVQKCGITGVKFDVILEDERHPSQVNHDPHHHDHHHDHQHHEHPHHHHHPHHVNSPKVETSHHHRNFNVISQIIRTSQLNDAVKKMSIAIFHEVAKAEALIHDKAIEDVHFHEVGAVDSIVDIVSTAIGIDYHGIEDIMCSPLHVGSGTVACAHGRLPVPAPATLEILKGIPIYQTELKGELVTPTGAAIVKVLSKRFGPMPQLLVEQVGYGSGTKDFEIANMVRGIIGKKKLIKPEQSADEVMLMEANIDDQNPEITAFTLNEILALGALDAWLEPLVMKKNRSGVKLSVLCKVDDFALIKSWLLTHTSTFGVRHQKMQRTVLEREINSVETCYGQVSIKLGYLNGELVKVSPEYESLVTIAKSCNVSLRKVERAALEVIWNSYRV